MRPVHRTTACAAMLLAAAWGAGCAAPPRTPSSPPPPAPALTWEQRFGEPQAPGPVAPDAYPVKERTVHYLRYFDAPAPAASPATGTAPAGESKTKIEELAIRWRYAEDDPDFPWRRHTTDGRVEHVRRNPDGSIVIGATEEPKHDALTQYDPPLVLWPAQLQPGKPVTSEHRMTIVSLQNPQFKRDAGRCTRTFEYDKDQSVRDEHHSIRCHRVRSTIRAKLGLASVLTRETFWIAPHHGLIAGDSTEAVTALLPLWIERRKIVMQPIPSPPPTDER